MLNLSIAGSLGRDAELRTAGQSQVCSFSVGVSTYDRAAKQKATVWVRVSVWGRRGERLAPMLSKGGRVACSGEMTLRTYVDKAGATVTSVELTAQDVTLLGGGERGERASSGGSAGGSRAPRTSHEEPGMPLEDDDDIPFIRLEGVL
jgi:single-strand DNA-binding protein